MTAQRTLFDAERGKELMERGLAYACDTRDEFLSNTKGIAVGLAEDIGEVTIDDVYASLSELDGSFLGPAAGSIFRDKNVWEFTGKWVRSTRTSNHARMVRVWRLRRGA